VRPCARAVARLAQACSCSNAARLSQSPILEPPLLGVSRLTSEGHICVSIQCAPACATLCATRISRSPSACPSKCTLGPPMSLVSSCSCLHVGLWSMLFHAREVVYIILYPRQMPRTKASMRSIGDNPPVRRSLYLAIACSLLAIVSAQLCAGKSRSHIDWPAYCCAPLHHRPRPVYACRLHGLEAFDRPCYDAVWPCAAFLDARRRAAAHLLELFVLLVHRAHMLESTEKGSDRRKSRCRNHGRAGVRSRTLPPNLLSIT
jgi:hypothetical protein